MADPLGSFYDVLTFLLWVWEDILKSNSALRGDDEDSAAGISIRAGQRLRICDI